MAKYRVESTSLNLRSQPVVAPSTKIAVLHHGQSVEKLEVASDPEWWRVSAVINGLSVTGFVNSSYLTAANDFVAPSSTKKIGAVHMSTNRLIQRASPSGRAFPLNESEQPQRTSKNLEKAAELRSIIDWLRVEDSARYKPKSGETYCNIYAYDYCYLANVYLPRVWWTSKAISKLQKGENVVPVYDQTILELNANSLYNWISEYGNDFGWRRVVDLTELQNEANSGSVCIMSARRKELNRPGHICAVVPETIGRNAVRKNGVVTCPLQSNAGATNFRYGGSIWWTSEKFSGFSFWVHA
ncbi:hypothetical protein [Zobellella sp. An-6]|uniref:hypothetical protein n=1 Tax=Zobellella sp. An-6 TaxID=3400218 RepID=UPI0040422C8D